jgi:xylulokinase
MLKKILDAVESSGIRIEEVHSMGGAARSDLWLQIKADICGHPFIRMEQEETPTLGAAIIASVKAGDYPSLEEAVAAIVKTGERFYPQKSRTEVYERSYRLYNELYGQLASLFRYYS